jgi:hypothetical protein
MIMTLEEYLNHKVEHLAERLASQAPADECLDCCLCEGHLIYDKVMFWYECKVCGKRWTPEHLEIDTDGKFQLLEFAD